MGVCRVAGGGRATAPVTGIPLSSFAEGNTVKINENGSPVEFYVAKHDYESGLNGAGRTLLARKDCYDIGMWTGDGGNELSTSVIDSFFNGAYKATLDAGVQGMIGTTKFYYTPQKSSTLTPLQRSIFPLSLWELGKTNTFAQKQGSTLPIASLLHPVYYNGNAVDQWTRTTQKSENQGIHPLAVSGSTVAYTGGQKGRRPCFTLPSFALFDEETLEFKGV